MIGTLPDTVAKDVDVVHDVDVHVTATRAKQPLESARLEALLSGRGLAIVGLLSFLLGTAFFLELSFQRGWIGPAQRIGLGEIFGGLLLVLSLRILRGAYRTIAEGTAGLGAGVAYLSSWAAIALYPDLQVPRIAVFGAMIAVTAVLAVAAERARAQALALFGLAGALLTPVLLASVRPERADLAAYLLIVTTALLLLARRRAFVALELATSIAVLPYTLAFVPNLREGWSDVAAATVASLFFVVFAAAFTMRPLGALVARARAVPIVVITALYAASLEAIFATGQTLLESSLAILAVALLAVSRTSLVPCDLTVAYRFLALVAANLALRAFVSGTSFYEAFAVEAALLVVFGTRTNAPIVGRVGVGLFGVATIGIVWDAFTLAPAHAWLTPLAFGFVVWARSAYTVRRAIPEQYARLTAGLGHAIALIGVTRIVVDGFGFGYGYGDAPMQVGFSVAWATFAAALFTRGVATRSITLRWEGLAIFAIVIIKVFTFDLANLDIAERVAAFMVTGAILVASSAWQTHAARNRTRANA